MSKELNVRIYNIVWEKPSVDECDWYCDECDANLNEQSGFDIYCGTWTCQECGHVNYIDDDNIVDDLPDEDYDTFYVYGSTDEIENEIPDHLEDKYGRRPISFDYDCDDNDYDEDDEHIDGYGEKISVWDAAQIWLSNGKDEDYMFGYTEDELEDALG